MTYVIGQAITLSTTVTAGAGAVAPVNVGDAIDAGTVALTVLGPMNLPAQATYGPFTPTRTGVGAYSYVFEPLHAGLYWYRFVTLTPDGASEAWFSVAVSPFVS